VSIDRAAAAVICPRLRCAATPATVTA